MNRVYSEHERQKIAEREYKAYGPNQLVKVKSDAGKYIEVGTVRQVVTDKTGLKAYIVESPDKKTVSVLYRGSEGPGKKGSKAERKQETSAEEESILCYTISQLENLIYL